MKKNNIVVIGGGSGLSTILFALKKLDINLSIIISVADDGGSTGELRKFFNIPAVGDIRQAISSLIQNDKHKNNDNLYWDKIFNYRFNNKKELFHNHTIGNLILTALIKMNNYNFQLAINQLKKLLKIKGKIIPVSEFPIHLNAKFTNDKIITGEHIISKEETKIKYIFYDKKVKANINAINAIKKANYIILSSGSLYTSILANCIIGGIQKALIANKKAKKIYIANIMQEPNETLHYKLSDHINAIYKHIKNDFLDIVIVNDKNIPQKYLLKYNKYNYQWVENDLLDSQNLKFKIIYYPLAYISNNYIRHDSSKLYELFINKILNN